MFSCRSNGTTAWQATSTKERGRNLSHVGSLRKLQRRSTSLHRHRRARVTTRAVKSVAHGSGNDLLVEHLTDLANQTVWATIWKAPLDYLTRDVRHDTASLMTATLEAIKRRDPDAAVVSYGRLLEDDRDRALESLSQLRGEAFDLSAFSQHERRQTLAEVTQTSA